MARFDLAWTAQQYVDRWLPRHAAELAALAQLSVATVEVDGELCRRIADDFDRQPGSALDDELSLRYRQFQQESLRQFAAIEAAGIRVLPWRGAGQPYRGARELRERVHATGVLYVYLTRAGHGPEPGWPDHDRHPMRAPSGVRRGGVELWHNDIFRAVHDAFGHLMFGHPMGLAGELLASVCHLVMYSEQVHPVLFTEQVSQICWFFCGAHLRTGSGRLPGPGEPGWVPPAARPYAAQKVFACPPELLARFRDSFQEIR